MVDIQPSDAPLNGVGEPLAGASRETVASKRQRRPSVRLGDIGGDQPHDSHFRRTSSSSSGAAASKQWKHQSHLPVSPSAAAASAKSSKTRALTNLSTDVNNETLDNEREANNNNGNLDGVAIGKYSGNEDNDDFELENSESPTKSHSPVHSLDNLRASGNEREVLYHGSNRRRPIRTRVSDGVELSGPSDTEMRRCEKDGVRIWLYSLGLGRYAPVFKIHEVDDEILPLLTLEDLKDMGINAVGSRRKMFCAIQKLSRGFSRCFLLWL
ncbi:Glycosyltransferase family 29 (sialyltransferase) family protein isoform 1 [Hibiscus syriacus]|uniref:Glycosyltransferase family 29 (Sialyltransferase) family protein isoform 1 n=1 Tax=Hibiscus syriacus TaxID=106335 RepID=A0A6A2WN21_HIBSY|nr:Glycosyltransferase family 29 (sialyltransferase) family protein isoform 1 [Hibiscus syriacus]